MRSLDLRKVDGVARASCQRVADDECSESTISSAIQRDESYHHKRTLDIHRDSTWPVMKLLGLPQICIGTKSGELLLQLIIFFLGMQIFRINAKCQNPKIDMLFSMLLLVPLIIKGNYKLGRGASY